MDRCVASGGGMWNRKEKEENKIVTHEVRRKSQTQMKQNPNNNYKGKGSGRKRNG